MATFQYGAQIRRFLLQFSRIFSDWSVSAGNDPNGNPIIKRVPIIYGDSSRQAATIIANNSANNLPSAPMIVYYISGLEYNQSWTTDPTFVDKLHVRQRAYDQDTQSYETTQGQAFTVERLMPVPYTLRMTVEIWTTNAQQTQELFEQLGVLFNPALEIQSTDNFVDWTSLSSVFQDGINYNTKSIPVGTTNPINVLTWKFYMPIWITAPAKLKKMGVIQKIIMSIHQGSTYNDIQDDDLLMGTRQKITPYGYKLLLIDGQLQLLPSDASTYPPNSSVVEPDSPNTDLYWSSILNSYGAIIPGISQIWIDNPYMDTCIVGTITPNPDDDRFLIYDIDSATMPQNTMDPVASVIDPQHAGPNAGLPGPTPGIRYLILNNIGSPGSSTIAWGNLVANANDIIQFNATSGEWFVAFNSKTATTVQYVTNLTTNLQYLYDNTEATWVKSIDGFVQAGDWSVVV